MLYGSQGVPVGLLGFGDQREDSMFLEAVV